MSNIISSFVSGQEERVSTTTSTASEAQAAPVPLREANQQFHLSQQHFQHV